MNPLIRARVDRFAKEFGFSGTLQENFEKWTANLLLGNALRSDPLLIEQAVVGGGDDGGIDIAGVIINGSLVTDPGDVDALREGGGHLNTVKVKFAQAKTSQSFNAPMAAKFLNGVERLSNAAASGGIDKIERSLRPTAQILEAVIRNIDLFSTPVPEVDIYYVTTADHEGSDAAADPQVLDAISRIESLQVFKKVDPQFLGSASLQERIAELQGVQDVPVLFERKIALPAVEGVEQAHIGYLPVPELANLLLDVNGEMREGIFDDNVRLYQGADNSVNKQIAGTLSSPDRMMFPYLNNGLTIVARRMSNIGDNYKVSGYQIVNGCQTSNELVNWMQGLGFEYFGDGRGYRVPDLADSVVVPVKFIQTSRSDILERVTTATNLQTSIGNTDIQGSTKLAKNVEEHFANSGPEGLRYGRQLGETDFSIAKTRIISTSDLNRAFSSAILGDSSTAIASPKQLERRDSEVWADYPLHLYYLAAWIAYKVDRLLAGNARGIRPAKYHLVMLAALLAYPELKELHGGNSKKNVKRRVAKSVGRDNWQDPLEDAIKSAEDLVAQYFEDTLSKKSLVKDDVRSKRVQDELVKLALDRVVENKSPSE